MDGQSDYPWVLPQETQFPLIPTTYLVLVQLCQSALLFLLLPSAYFHHGDTLNPYLIILIGCQLWFWKEMIYIYPSLKVVSSDQKRKQLDT